MNFQPSVYMKRLLLYLLAIVLPLTAHADPLGSPGLGRAILAALLIIGSSIFTLIYALTFFMSRLNKTHFSGAKLFAWVMISLFIAVLVLILAMGINPLSTIILFGGFLLALYSLKTNDAYNALIKESPKQENN